MANEFIIKNGFISKGDSSVEGIFSASTIILSNLTSGTSTTSLFVNSSGQIITGTTGTSGGSGSSGTSGTSGTSGLNGTSGTSGTSGVNGTSGTSGINGTSGTSGTSGLSGTSGTSGTSGINGTSGTSGIDGTSGTSGINGTSGTSGISGTSGTSGVNGTSGTSGFNGTSGTSGLSGTSGTSGINGTSGTSGTSGINGTSGTSGISGTSGTSGINGTSGTSGTSGINGTSGTSGTSGINGTSGTSGTSGINGTSGTSGISGTSGTSGINGISGTSGTSGVNGTSGTSGTSGINGTSGTSGTSGVATILNNVVNRVLLSTGTSGVVSANSDLTYNGTIFNINTDISIASNSGLPMVRISSNSNSALGNIIRFIDTDTAAVLDQNLGRIEFMTSDSTSSPTPAVKAYIAAVTDALGSGNIIFGTTASTGSISASTSTSTTGERMRIDETGFVGINTSAPQYRLDVNSGIRTTDQVSAQIVNSSSEGVRFAPYVGASSYFSLSELGDTVMYGTVGENLIVGATNGAAWRFSGNSGVQVGGVMHTGANVGVGIKPDSGIRLHVDGTIKYTTRPAAGTGTAIIVDTNNILKEQTSSYKFKENIQPYNKGLNDILQLSSVTYNYKEENILNAGFIAEDLDDKDLKEFIFYRDNQPHSISYGNMVALLVNGIKEQNQLINELRDEIELLKQRLNNP